MYYDDLFEIIEKQKRVLDGCEVKNLFIAKYGSGSIINMNKALKKLRKDDKVCSKQIGRRFYYWAHRLDKTDCVKSFFRHLKKPNKE